MRYTALVIFLGASAFGQAIIEHAAAAAGGSAGGVAGKKVSDSINSIFTKVEKTTAKAASPDRPPVAPEKSTGRRASADDTPLLEVSPGVPKGTESVPPPPPRHVAVHRAAPAPKPVAAPEPLPPPPPPPDVTAADLKRVTAGMNRDAVLQLGPPSTRITMFDDGHLVEVFRYMAKESTVGVVRLSDGAVATVEVR